MSDPVALGLDVGGTKVAAVLLDRAHRVRGRVDVPTLREEGQALEQTRRAAALAADLALSEGLSLSRAGIGVPELVANDGRVCSAWNFDWRGLDLAAALGLTVPLSVESDVRAAALAEMRLGHGSAYPTFAYIIAGTGLSYAFCVDGRLHRGARGFAIHFASSDLLPVCGACGRQTPFNLEGFASGGGLRATYARRTGTSLADARAIIDGEAGGDGAVLFAQATSAVAAALGQIVDMLDPHALVLGGGLGLAPRYVEAVRAELPRHVWAEEARGIPLLPSSIGRDGGAIGAALAAMEAGG